MFPDLESATNATPRILEWRGLVRQGTEARRQSLDVHALRTAFATGLARAGVPLRQAQELCRHSTPELTSRVYQRLRVVDVLGAVESLPAPFGDRKAKGGQRVGAEGQREPG